MFDMLGSKSVEEGINKVVAAILATKPGSAEDIFEKYSKILGMMDMSIIKKQEMANAIKKINEMRNKNESD